MFLYVWQDPKESKITISSGRSFLNVRLLFVLFSDTLLAPDRKSWVKGKRSVTSVKSPNRNKRLGDRGKQRTDRTGFMVVSSCRKDGNVLGLSLIRYRFQKFKYE